MENTQLEGKRVPSVTFKTRVPDTEASAAGQYKWQDVASDELFAGKKIVLFALPGAFTPTCSSFQLPGYEAQYDDFKAAGIDEVYCLAVNDSYVMNKWAESQKVSKVKMLPDGSGLFTKGLDMLVKKDNLGFGERSWRYAIYVEDGVIKKAFIEPGFCDNSDPDPFEVSDAQHMLEFLKMQAA
jgi:peroxiredoxin